MPHEWVNPAGQGTGVLLGLAFFLLFVFVGGGVGGGVIKPLQLLKDNISITTTRFRVLGFRVLRFRGLGLRVLEFRGLVLRGLGFRGLGV